MAQNYDFVFQIIGLDNVGKTTIMRNFQDNKTPILPTSNVNLISSEIGNNKLKVVFIDCSGNGRFRDTWKNNYKKINGLIYVIDIYNSERIIKDKKLLKDIFINEDIINNKIPIMILLNKIDKNENMNVDIDSIKETLEIDKINKNNLKYFFKQVSGILNQNINESFEYLLNIVKSK